MKASHLFVASACLAGFLHCGGSVAPSSKSDPGAASQRETADEAAAKAPAPPSSAPPPPVVAVPDAGSMCSPLGISQCPYCCAKQESSGYAWLDTHVDPCMTSTGDPGGDAFGRFKAVVWGAT